MSAIQKKTRKPPPRLPDPTERVAKDYFTEEEYLQQVRAMPIFKLVGELKCFWDNKKNGTMGPNFEKALLQVEREKDAELRAYVHNYTRRTQQAWERENEERRATDNAAEHSRVEFLDTGKGGKQRYLVADPSV